MPISPPADLRELLLREHHDVGIAGHLGVTKTVKYLQRQYHWPRMRQLVRNYIKICEQCQRVKSTNQLPAGLLKPLQIPKDKWASVSMDFIVGLPTTVNNYDAILVVVDWSHVLMYSLTN